MLRCGAGRSLDQGPIEHYGVKARFSARRKGSRKEPRDDINKTRTSIAGAVVGATRLYLNSYRFRPPPLQDGGGGELSERVSAFVRKSLLRVGAGCHEVWL